MEVSKPLDYTAQLVTLRDLSRRFELLHPAQELQLALWAEVCVDAGYDYLVENLFKAAFSTKTIHYEWSGTMPKLDTKYIQRLKELHSNVRFLLGDEWNLQILFNGETIYPIRENARKHSPKRRVGKPGKRKLAKRNRNRRAS
jgi:hypothetical protein